MKQSTKVISIGAACAACCAVPVILPAAAGLGLAAVSPAIVAGGLLAAAAAAGGIMALRARPRASEVSACKIDGSCGCKGMEGNR